MRLVHLSDVHYLARLAVPGTRFMNKRITGLVNLKLLRRFQHDSGLLEHIIAAIDDARPDHIAITGDLTNLSLGIEFAQFRLLLDRIGLGPESITVVPGNHDRYTAGSDRDNRVMAYLGPYMSGDDCRNGSFPVVRVRSGTAIVGLDTSMSRPPFVASGKLGDRQIARLADALEQGPVKDAFPVVLLHHPPYRWTTNRLFLLMNGLVDRQQLRKALHGRNSLVLHGHLHRNMYRRHVTTDGTMTLVGVSSATRHGRLKPHLSSTFHAFDIEGGEIRSVLRYTLDEMGPGYTVSEVSEKEFLPLVTADRPPSKPA